MRKKQIDTLLADIRSLLIDIPAVELQRLLNIGQTKSYSIKSCKKLPRRDELVKILQYIESKQGAKGRIHRKGISLPQELLQRFDDVRFNLINSDALGSKGRGARSDQLAATKQRNLGLNQPDLIQIGEIPTTPFPHIERSDENKILNEIKEKTHIALFGPSGMGKTQIAYSAWNSFKKDKKRDLIWVNATTLSSFQKTMAKYCRALGIEYLEGSEITYCDILLGNINTHTRPAFFIFDDLNIKEIPYSMIPNNPKIKVLITTQDPSIHSFCETIRVTYYDELEFSSLKDIAKEKLGVEITNQLATSLGNHPLAISYALQCLCATGMKESALIRNVHEDPFAILSFNIASYKRPLCNLFEQIVSSLMENDEENIRTLLFIAWISVNRSPFPLIEEILGTFFPCSSKAHIFHMVGQQILEMDTENECVFIHTLLSKWLRTKFLSHQQSADFQLEVIKYFRIALLRFHATLLSELLALLQQFWFNVKQDSVADLHRLFVSLILEVFEIINQPLALTPARGLIDDLSTLGAVEKTWLVKKMSIACLSATISMDLGEYEKSSEALRGIYNYSHEIAEEDSEKFAYFHCRYVVSLSLMESCERAIEIGNAVHDFCKGRFGLAHPRTSDARYALAYAYRTAHSYRDALKLDMLNVKFLDIDSHVTLYLASRCHVGRDLRFLDKISWAIAWDEETLEMCTRMLGVSARNTIRHRGQLAEAYLHSGRVADAIELDSDNLSMRIREFGDSHPETSLNRINLARAWEEQGNLDVAVALVQNACMNYGLIFGSDHPRTHAAEQYLHSLRHRR